MTVTWEQYMARPEAREEYVDGEVILVNPPRISHQDICLRLAMAIYGALQPGLKPVQAGGWLVSKQPRILRIPDLMVIPQAFIGGVFEDIPRLVVEILSTDRYVDLYSKAAEYAQVGLPRYWIADPRDGVLEAMILRDGNWRLEARLDADTSTGDLETGAGTVSLDLAALFA